MKWKIDNKGFKLLLSLPQLFGCCFDDRIHSCSTQIHKVTVISGTQKLGGGLYRDREPYDKEKLFKHCSSSILKGRCVHNT